MDKKFDLHEELLNQLNNMGRKKTDLSVELADLLKIEQDPAYRRLLGNVNFTVRELGLIADHYNISLDTLMRRSDGVLWLPFKLVYPMGSRSLDSLYEIVSKSIERIGKITAEDGYSESGSVYNSMPMEFFLFYPTLTKFMFFKWGYSFIGASEFDKFSDWTLPEKFLGLGKELATNYRFKKIYYIWDRSLVWNLCWEIMDFYRANVITEEEKKEIGMELKMILSAIERSLNGTYIPKLPLAPETDFYVSSQQLGFVGNYFMSEAGYGVYFQTNFSFAAIDDDPGSFEQAKNWIDSFRHICIHLSKSGRHERRIFFEEQTRIVDHVLKFSNVSIY